jgi:16S rRNA (guanine966-N2)-methyltransferase
MRPAPANDEPLSERTPRLVRVIGGRWRGRRLRFPELPGLRPTPDRVRETLFNWLGQDLGGRTCFDAYTGSGALALEAASRGASVVVAIDCERRAIAALREHAERLGATALEIHLGDARRLLERERRRFDVIFLDPPFAEDPWRWLLPLARERLADSGLIYAEAGHVLAPVAGTAVLRCDKAGQVHYHLFARSAAAADQGTGGP